MATSLKLTRNQLASFLKDPEQIKQFERLILLVNDYLNSGEVAGLSDTLGNVLAATNANTAAIQALAETLDRSPPPVDLGALYERLGALEALSPLPDIWSDRLSALEAVPSAPDLAAILSRLDALDAAPVPPVSASGVSVEPSAITPSGSPYTYVNATGYEADIILSVGTVTLVEFGRGATFTNTGIIAGMFRLSPFDSIRVTYAVAPTMTLVTR